MTSPSSITPSPIKSGDTPFAEVVARPRLFYHQLLKELPPAASKILSGGQMAERDRDNTTYYRLSPDHNEAGAIYWSPGEFFRNAFFYLPYYQIAAEIYYGGSRAAQIICGSDLYPIVNDIDLFIFVSGISFDYYTYLTDLLDWALKQHLPPGSLITSYRRITCIFHQNTQAVNYKLCGQDITLIFNSNCLFHTRASSFLVPMTGNIALSLCGDYEGAVEDVTRQHVVVPNASAISGRGNFILWRYLARGWSIPYKEQELQLADNLSNLMKAQPDILEKYLNEHYQSRPLEKVLFLLNAYFYTAYASPLSNEIKACVRRCLTASPVEATSSPLLIAILDVISRAPDKESTHLHWLSWQVSLLPPRRIRGSPVPQIGALDEESYAVHRLSVSQEPYSAMYALAIATRDKTPLRLYLIIPADIRVLFLKMEEAYYTGSAPEISGLFARWCQPIITEEITKWEALSTLPRNEQWPILLCELFGGEYLPFLYPESLAFNSGMMAKVLYDLLSQAAKGRPLAADLLYAQIRWLWIWWAVDPKRASNSMATAAIKLIGKLPFLLQQEDRASAYQALSLLQELTGIQIPMLEVPVEVEEEGYANCLSAWYADCWEVDKWSHVPEQHLLWLKKHHKARYDVWAPMLVIDLIHHWPEKALALWRSQPYDHLEAFVTIIPLLLQDPDEQELLIDHIQTLNLLFSRSTALARSKMQEKLQGALDTLTTHAIKSKSLPGLKELSPLLEAHKLQKQPAAIADLLMIMAQEKDLDLLLEGMQERLLELLASNGSLSFSVMQHLYKKKALTLVVTIGQAAMVKHLGALFLMRACLQQLEGVETEQWAQLGIAALTLVPEKFPYLSVEGKARAGAELSSLSLALVAQESASALVIAYKLPGIPDVNKHHLSIARTLITYPKGERAFISVAFSLASALYKLPPALLRHEEELLLNLDIYCLSLVPLTQKDTYGRWLSFRLVNAKKPQHIPFWEQLITTPLKEDERAEVLAQGMLNAPQEVRSQLMHEAITLHLSCPGACPRLVEVIITTMRSWPLHQEVPFNWDRVAELVFHLASQNDHKSIYEILMLMYTNRHCPGYSGALHSLPGLYKVYIASLSRLESLSMAEQVSASMPLLLLFIEDKRCKQLIANTLKTLLLSKKEESAKSIKNTVVIIKKVLDTALWNLEESVPFFNHNTCTLQNIIKATLVAVTHLKKPQAIASISWQIISHPQYQPFIHSDPVSAIKIAHMALHSRKISPESILDWLKASNITLKEAHKGLYLQTYHEMINTAAERFQPLLMLRVLSLFIRAPITTSPSYPTINEKLPLEICLVLFNALFRLRSTDFTELSEEDLLELRSILFDCGQSILTQIWESAPARVSSEEKPVISIIIEPPDFAHPLVTVCEETLSMNILQVFLLIEKYYKEQNLYINELTTSEFISIQRNILEVTAASNQLDLIQYACNLWSICYNTESKLSDMSLNIAFSLLQKLSLLVKYRESLRHQISLIYLTIFSPHSLSKLSKKQFATLEKRCHEDIMQRLTYRESPNVIIFAGNNYYTWLAACRNQSIKPVKRDIGDLLIDAIRAMPIQTAEHAIAISQITTAYCLCVPLSDPIVAAKASTAIARLLNYPPSDYARESLSNIMRAVHAHIGHNPRCPDSLVTLLPAACRYLIETISTNAKWGDIAQVVSSDVGHSLFLEHKENHDIHKRVLKELITIDELMYDMFIYKLLFQWEKYLKDNPVALRDIELENFLVLELSRYFRNLDSRNDFQSSKNVFIAELFKADGNGLLNMLGIENYQTWSQLINSYPRSTETTGRLSISHHKNNMNNETTNEWLENTIHYYEEVREDVDRIIYINRGEDPLTLEELLLDSDDSPRSDSEN